MLPDFGPIFSIMISFFILKVKIFDSFWNFWDFSKVKAKIKIPRPKLLDKDLNNVIKKNQPSTFQTEKALRFQFFS